MAMVGLHKGNSNGNRGGNKPYGMMLLLAFGAALLGVMMIHKLRERRIFNLLVKEKDHQLISLQLLLQKEREYTKEMKRKAEEMKAKIYSLRNQNMETDRRVLEMKSTIHSLKDERKILESALEERQNDLKMNRKKITGQEKENPQVTALMESLKQKEAEIEDLKQHLEISLKRGSVGTDNDLSNIKPNFSVTGNLVDDGTRSSQSKTVTGELYKSTNFSNGVNLLERGADALTNIIKSENTGRRQNTSESKGSLSVNEENNTANATGATVNPFRKLVNTGDTDSEMRSAYGQEHTVATDGQMGLKNSEQVEGQDEGTFKGGLKLEMADSSKTSKARMKGKYTKEKRWRKLARNRRLVNNRNDENSEAEGIGKRKIPVDNQNQLRDREEATSYNNGSTDEQRVMGVNNKLEVTKVEDLSNAKLLKSRNSEDSKDTRNIPVIEDAVQHLKKLQENGSFDAEATGTRTNVTKEGSGLDGVEYKSQENKSRDMKMQNSAAQENTVKDGRQEENDDADVDNGADMATGEFYRELLPDFEENKEEYKEETEEPEF